jgi:hypothetical protein
MGSRPSPSTAAATKVVLVINSPICRKQTLLLLLSFLQRTRREILLLILKLVSVIVPRAPTSSSQSITVCIRVARPKYDLNLINPPLFPSAPQFLALPPPSVTPQIQNGSILSSVNPFSIYLSGLHGTLTGNKQDADVY